MGTYDWFFAVGETEPLEDCIPEFLSVLRSMNALGPRREDPPIISTVKNAESSNSSLLVAGRSAPCRLATYSLSVNLLSVFLITCPLIVRLICVGRWSDICVL